MAVDTSVKFTGIQFENPFLLSSAPPTESESNIMRAFDAGWGGVVTKTIGLHPVVNVYGAKAKFMRTSTENAHVSMKKRDNAALHSSWNWELISDKPMDWWEPRIRRIKEAHPGKVLIVSIMAGSGNDKELGNWQLLAERSQEAGADGLELNFSCPHMDRKDMGSNIGKDKVLCSTVTEAVKEVAKVPVWCKLTPATANIVEEAGACFIGGADAIVSSNTFPSLPLFDAETLEFEINVDGYVSSGGLGGAGDSPDGARENGAAHAGVPGQELLRNRWHLRHGAGRELLRARMRHSTGLHRGNARSRHRSERHQAAQRGVQDIPREAQFQQPRRFPRFTPGSRRSPVADPQAE